MSSATEINIDKEVLLGFIDESKEALNAVDPLFIKLEHEPDNTDLINSIFRPIHSLKGNAPFFGFMSIKTLAHELESLLGLIRSKKIPAVANVISCLLKGADELKMMLERASQGQPEIGNKEYFDGLLSEVKNIITSPPSKDSNRETSPTTLSTNQNSITEQPPTNLPTAVASDTQKSMRVSEERIDTFLSFVGELIIVGETLRHLITRMDQQLNDRKLLKDFITLQQVFSQLSFGLEGAIMSVRKVPVKGMLQKTPRLVRDIASKNGKEIKVEISGDGLEIDKSLAELLDAPLIHMVRNSADHGIETPEIREAAGKPREGTITIKCEESERFIVLTVQDDGAGINHEGLRKKGEALGLIAPGSKLSEKDIVNLIFEAGVSTATQVSDISGRGVGMDVVKRSIDAAGGSIRVETTPGMGTIFTVNLVKSVTTQIIRGFVVSVKENQYVIPLKNVLETWCFDMQSASNSANRDLLISRHDEVLPLRFLSDILGAPKSFSQSGSELAVTLSLNGSKVAMVVDQVLGSAR